MIKVRLIVQAGGQRHVTEWAPAREGATDRDEVRDRTLDELAQRVRHDLDGVLPVTLGDGTRRLLNLDRVDWIDVEARER